MVEESSNILIKDKSAQIQAALDESRKMERKHEPEPVNDPRALLRRQQLQRRRSVRRTLGLEE